MMTSLRHASDCRCDVLTALRVGACGLVSPLCYCDVVQNVLELCGKTL